MRDEAPKAPVLLYAVETRNPFDQEKESAKYELMKANRGLWLGDLLPAANLVVPFDSDFMQSYYFTGQKLFGEMLGEYKSLLYHQSALQALVMNALA